MPLHDSEKGDLRYLESKEISPDLYSPSETIAFTGFEQPLIEIDKLDRMGLHLKSFSAPNDLVWDLTSQCALRCVFCLGSFPVKSEELSSEEKKALAQELVDVKIWGINLSGGEPLLCPDLPWLVDFFANNEIPVIIGTSGWGLTKDLAAHLAKSGMVTVCFSLDAPVAVLHDELRGRQGAFETAIQSLQLLQRMGAQSLMVECVIMQKNIRYVNEMIEFCRSVGVQLIRFQPVVLVGRGWERTDLSLSEEQLRALANNVQSTRERIFSKVASHPERPRIQVHLIDQTTHIAKGMETGRNWGGLIKSDGTLKVSNYLHYTFGNIRRAGGFMNLWRSGFNVAWRHPELQRTLASVKTIKDIERLARDMNYADRELDVRDIYPEVQQTCESQTG